MKTMYRVEANRYTDCEGRHTNWEQMNGYVATIEEAKAMAKNITKSYVNTGDWRVVARTMDEETFTVVDEVVESFDYYKEVYRYEQAKKMVAIYAEKIAEIEASKKRCRTEKGIERKENEIAQYKKWMEKEEKIIAEKA